MADWLVKPIQDHPVDIYAVGLEEMVDLTAQNMVVTAQKHRQEWATEIMQVVGSGYALVTSVQLVGVCLYILIKNEHLHGVKEVVPDTVKTGAGGRVGNKGGAAVRFRFYNTSLCFVCAHLAAGQNHVAERNSDYADITRRLSFGKGRTLTSHDYVFWFVSSFASAAKLKQTFAPLICTFLVCSPHICLICSHFSVPS